MPREINIERRAALLRGLDHFCATDDYYKTLMASVVYTDGVRYMAKEGCAYWLIDAVVSHQQAAWKNERLADFQVWQLKVNDDGSAVLSCHEDLPGPELIRQEIDHTDFPLDTIKLYVARQDVNQWVIMLPSEY